MIRTRIAPSPTGPQMHIGNFRTALYSYYWAKKNQGEFLIRVEDTDRKRYVSGSVEGYMKLFNAFGLKVDLHPTEQDIAEMETPELPSANWITTPDKWKSVADEDFENKYIQTQRLPLYLKYALELIEKGNAYLCFLTEDELKSAKEALPKYQPFRSPHRYFTKAETEAQIKAGKPFVVRLNVEKYIQDKAVHRVDYTDLVLGKMSFDLNTVDDQVLVKSNGIPTYHLAVVVDDHAMKITHPIRGYGWLPSTPKQIMLYDMLGWNMPPFAHVTDVLDPAGGKLSKRRGAVFTTEFLKAGYLPEAIINFISLVGWTPKIERKSGEKERELFSLNEIIELFDLKDVSKANPVFNPAKLLWFGQQYIKIKTPVELEKSFRIWLQEYQNDNPLTEKILADSALAAKLKLVQERASTLVEVLNSLEFFYTAPEKVALNIKQTEGFRDLIVKMLADITAIMGALPEAADQWEQALWVEKMRALSDKYGLKGGDSFMLLRLAVVGQPFSPPLFEAMQILGKTEVLERLSRLA